MLYEVEFRRVINDACVTPWKVFTDCPKRRTPLAAYDILCKQLNAIVQVCGFVDAPEWGMIRTGRGYADHTLFQHPEDRDIQYRIVEVEEINVQSNNDDSREILI